MRVAEMIGVEQDETLRACYAGLDRETPSDYRELAALLASQWRFERPALVGLGGGQGAGKSTLGRLIESACRHFGLRACAVGLDDFYRSKAERRKLAQKVHPLLETRGPPGTHDMKRCAESLTALRGAGEVELPIFDKARDDRMGTRRVVGPFDVVILEGWCVGVRESAVAALRMPPNELEATLDANGIWRRFIGRALLEGYEPVWDRLDRLITLQVPSLEAVRRWRLQQESERSAEHRMNAGQVDRFVQHYERITRAMLESMPEIADWLVELDESHRISAVSVR